MCTSIHINKSSSNQIYSEVSFVKIKSDPIDIKWSKRLSKLFLANQVIINFFFF